MPTNAARTSVGEDDLSNARTASVDHAVRRPSLIQRPGKGNAPRLSIVLPRPTYIASRTFTNPSSSGDAAAFEAQMISRRTIRRH